MSVSLARNMMAQIYNCVARFGCRGVLCLDRTELTRLCDYGIGNTWL